jgi:hypothetical protein
MVGFTSMFGQNVASFALAGKLGEEIARQVPCMDYLLSGPAPRESAA